MTYSQRSHPARRSTRALPKCSKHSHHPRRKGAPRDDCGDKGVGSHGCRTSAERAARVSPFAPERPWGQRRCQGEERVRCPNRVRDMPGVGIKDRALCCEVTEEGPAAVCMYTLMDCRMSLTAGNRRFCCFRVFQGIVLLLQQSSLWPGCEILRRPCGKNAT